MTERKRFNPFVPFFADWPWLATEFTHHPNTHVASVPRRERQEQGKKTLAMVEIVAGRRPRSVVVAVAAALSFLLILLVVQVVTVKVRLNLGDVGNPTTLLRRQLDNDTTLSTLSRGNSHRPPRLFYCGASWAAKPNQAKSRGELPKYNVLGPILAEKLFPALLPNGRDRDAIPLTQETLLTATSDDLLMYQMHQWCDVDSNLFPGKILHVNSEYYDLHPNYKLNRDSDGKYLLNYIPPYSNSYMLGAHPNGPKSIRVTYAQLLFATLSPLHQRQITHHSEKPKNTRKHFVLYANSHFVKYREETALSLSQIGTVHTLGKCQGNVDPNLEDDWSSTSMYNQCLPFPESHRPPSIVPYTEQPLDPGRFNSNIFKDFRFALVMENINSPGYVTEKILGAFLGGAVPIYYGTEEVFNVFNRHAFVYMNPADPGPALARIARLEANRDEYESTLAQPILNDGVNTIRQYLSFEDGIGDGALKHNIWRMLGYDGSNFAPNRLPFRLVLAGRPHAGATILANILMGLFDRPGSELCYQVPREKSVDICPSQRVIKTHTSNGTWQIQGMEHYLTKSINSTETSRVFFVVPTRRELSDGELEVCSGGGGDQKEEERKKSKVLCLDYTNVPRSTNAEKRRAVLNVIVSLAEEFPLFAGYNFDVDAAVERLEGMEQAEKALANEPFDVWDKTYGVHGGIRENGSARGGGASTEAKR